MGFWAIIPVDVGCIADVSDTLTLSVLKALNTAIQPAGKRCHHLGTGSTSALNYCEGLTSSKSLFTVELESDAHQQLNGDT